jgi:hypothetical protein
VPLSPRKYAVLMVAQVALSVRRQPHHRRYGTSDLPEHPFRDILHVVFLLWSTFSVKVA